MSQSDCRIAGPRSRRVDDLSASFGHARARGLGRSTGASKAATGAAIDAFIETITATLVKGENVQLIGFGSVGAGTRAARTGRNPKTGEAIQIPAAKTVKFTAGKAFNDAVNNS